MQKTCWYCDRSLSLAKRLKGDLFCSKEHEDLYHAGQSQIAVDRVIGFAKQASAPAPLEARKPLVAKAPEPEAEAVQPPKETPPPAAPPQVKEPDNEPAVATLLPQLKSEPIAPAPASLFPEEALEIALEPTTPLAVLSALRRLELKPSGSLPLMPESASPGEPALSSEPEPLTAEPEVPALPPLHIEVAAVEVTVEADEPPPPADFLTAWEEEQRELEEPSSFPLYKRLHPRPSTPLRFSSFAFDLQGPQLASVQAPVSAWEWTGDVDTNVITPSGPLAPVPTIHSAFEPSGVALQSSLPLCELLPYTGPSEQAGASRVSTEQGAPEPAVSGEIRLPSLSVTKRDPSLRENDFAPPVPVRIDATLLDFSPAEAMAVLPLPVPPLRHPSHAPAPIHPSLPLEFAAHGPIFMPAISNGVGSAISESVLEKPRTKTLGATLRTTSVGSIEPRLRHAARFDGILQARDSVRPALETKPTVPMLRPMIPGIASVAWISRGLPQFSSARELNGFVSPGEAPRTQIHAKHEAIQPTALSLIELPQPQVVGVLTPPRGRALQSLAGLVPGDQKVETAAMSTLAPAPQTVLLAFRKTASSGLPLQTMQSLPESLADSAGKPVVALHGHQPNPARPPRTASFWAWHSTTLAHANHPSEFFGNLRASTTTPALPAWVSPIKVRPASLLVSPAPPELSLRIGLASQVTPLATPLPGLRRGAAAAPPALHLNSSTACLASLPGAGSRIIYLALKSAQSPMDTLGAWVPANVRVENVPLKLYTAKAAGIRRPGATAASAAPGLQRQKSASLFRPRAKAVLNPIAGARPIPRRIDPAGPPPKEISDKLGGQNWALL